VRRFAALLAALEVWVIAREYGYPELPGPAIGTPGVEEVLRRRERAGRVWGIPALAVQGTLAIALLQAGGPAAAAGVLVAVTFAVTAGLVHLWRRARRRERRALEVYGWQVWPCQRRSVRVVSAGGVRAGGRRWSSAGRVVLMRPDGQSHCSFPPPWEGWDGPPAGDPPSEDTVWFAGDTRFGGILAVTGGLPFRYVTREKPGTRPGTAEEDALAVRAGLLRPGSRARGKRTRS
jgi:hypothetical protein